MKKRLNIYVLAAFVAISSSFLACQSLDSPAGRQILEVTLRVATYQVVQNNPDVGPASAIKALLILIVAGALAGVIPAQRAVAVPPVEALRAE